MYKPSVRSYYKSLFRKRVKSEKKINETCSSSTHHERRKERKKSQKKKRLLLSTRIIQYPDIQTLRLTFVHPPSTLKRDCHVFNCYWPLHKGALPLGRGRGGEREGRRLHSSRAATPSSTLPAMERCFKIAKLGKNTSSS